MSEPADLQDLMQMADTTRTLFLALMEAGFPEAQAFALLPALSIHAVILTKHQRDQ